VVTVGRGQTEPLAWLVIRRYGRDGATPIPCAPGADGG